eukprot:6205187-Pleurochrysis_carterae.AAC.5
MRACLRMPLRAHASHARASMVATHARACVRMGCAHALSVSMRLSATPRALPLERRLCGDSGRVMPSTTAREETENHDNG